MNEKRKGHFDLGDEPEKVKKAAKNSETGDIMLEVIWKYNEKEKI